VQTGRERAVLAADSGMPARQEGLAGFVNLSQSAAARLAEHVWERGWRNR